MKESSTSIHTTIMNKIQSQIMYLKIWSSLSRTWGSLKVKIMESAKPYTFFWTEDTLSTCDQTKKLES